MEHTQIVLVEFDNSCPGIYKVRSSLPITINRVATHFEEMEGFNEDKDSLTFLDDASDLVLMDEPGTGPVEG